MSNEIIFDAIEKLFNDISTKIKQGGFSVSLDELYSRYNDALSKIILEEERRENCKYISGEFKISCVGNEKYQCSYELYFEDAGESFHVLRAQTGALDIGGLTEDFQTELKRERVLKFEIEEP